MTEYWIQKRLRELREINPWYHCPEYDTGADRTLSTAVNVVGYFRDESGWGAAGRGYLRALRRLGIPHSVVDLSQLSSNRSGDPGLGAWPPGTRNPESTYPHSINLVCVDAGQHHAFAQHVGDDFLDGRYNIAAWAWELPRFPEKWYDRFAYYDEVWTTTSFIANALAPISPIPVVRIPPVLTPVDRGNRARGRSHIAADDDERIFLFVFDFHSHMERKNPLATIDAFNQAFSPSDPVRLVIKCVNGNSDPTGFAAMLDRARGHRVSIYDGYWSTNEMRDLMTACDVYISLHRSEGTGLTITDAMALGKPVIATGWSGNMDFMTVANSLPVRYELTTIQENVGPYRAGETWAEPSIEHAAELMRYVHNSPAVADKLGQAARSDIERSFSEGAIANLVDSRLQTIAHRHELGPYREVARDFARAYRELTSEVRRTINSFLPEGATALVVSRGDPDLVGLDRRQGWHFPRTEDGLYAGYHPADSTAAIGHLESLRDAGAEYLVFPATAFWWLDYYAEFCNHLESHYTCLVATDRCRIYTLTRVAAEPLRTRTDERVVVA